MRIGEFVLVIVVGLLNCSRPTESVLGCVTIMINAKSKQCICSRLTTKFTRIPSKLPDNVVKLEVKNQEIHALTSDQLTNVDFLEDLNLDTNKLSSIDTDAFVNVQKLIHLSLKNNHLILGGNSLPPEALLHLKNLRSLDLENNPLGFVPDFFFQPLKMLQRLSLSRAPEGFYLEANSLAGLTSLESLDLSMSHLTSLKKQIQTAFSNMQLLELLLFGNRWNCDCNLKWLKKWWLKYKEVKISKKFKRVNGETGIAQPQCFTPNRFKGHNIFEVSAEYDTIQLNQLYCPPKIFTPNKPVSAEYGQNVTLTCEFEADPGGDVQWSKNGMIVKSHWKRIRWGQTSGMRFTAWLLITKAEVEDNGLWKCTLITNIERANATFSLRVKHFFSPTIDLTIILKYIGIGAITLILLLVIIGIAIYCVYGFRIRPFVKQNKELHPPEIGRSIRPTRLDGDNHHAENNIIRPLMVNALLNKDKRQTEEDLNKFCGNDDSQKCLLLPSSPALVIPITNKSIINNSSHFPCPLHGNINFIDHGAFSDNKQHSTIDYINPIGFMQPHTLPRQNNKTLNRVKTNPVFIQPSTHQNSSNCISCPLHGNIIASLQRQSDEDTDNINSIYSTFFSPRHSQPMINNNPSRMEPDTRNSRMTTSMGDSFQIASSAQPKDIPTMSVISSFPTIPINVSSRGLPNPIHSAAPQKPHDDEGYSTSV